MDDTLHGLFEKAASRFPHGVAVVYDDGQVVVRKTYSQLQRDVEQVKCILEDVNGEGEVIGLACPPNDLLPSLVLGVLSLPATFHYIDLKGGEYSLRGVSYLRIQYVIADIDSLQEVGELFSSLGLSIELITNDWLLESGLQLLHLREVHLVKERQLLAYCITTSGTTGLPKVVKVPHACIVPNIIHLREIFQITEEDMLFLASPLTFDPSIIDLFLALSTGAALLIIPPIYKIMPQKLVAMTTDRHCVTVLQVTPALISSIGSELMKTSLLSDDTKLRVLAFGGEKCPSPGMLGRMKSPANQTQFYNLYGTTEVSCWATCYSIRAADFEFPDEPVPLGSALCGTDVEVRSEDGVPVTQGEGELFIGGTTRVCWLEKEDTAGDGCLVPRPAERLMRSTGDWVRVKLDGQMVYMGRMDDQIKRHGMRLSLTTLEQVVSQLLFVNAAAAVIVKGEMVIFVACGSNDAQKAVQVEVEVCQHLQMNLPMQYQVDSVRMLHSLPITKHGKVDKAELVRLAEISDEPQHVMYCDEGIRSAIEQKWQSCLPQDGIGRNIEEDDMFVLSGGNSFCAVRLVTSLEEMFACSIPMLLDFILHKTFGNICIYVGQILKTKHGQMENSKDFAGGVLTDKVEAFNDEQPCEDNPGNVDRPEASTDLEDMAKQIDTDTLNSNSSELEFDVRKRKGMTFKSDNGVDHKRFKVSTAMDNTDHNFFSLSEYKSCYALSRGNRIVPVVGDKWSVVTVTSTTSCEANTGTVNSSGQCNLNRSPLTCLKPSCHGISPSGGCKHCPCLTDSLSHLTIEEVWRYDTGKCVDSSPLVVVSRNEMDGIVYMGSHSHWFCAISMATGRALWETIFGDRVESSACISGRFVVVGCYDHHVYALNAGDGSVHWKFKTNGEVKSSPVSDSQTSLVFVGSHDQHLYALDVQNRRCSWRCDLGCGSLFASPCLSSSPHCLFATTLGGLAACLQPESGQILWEYKCDKPIFSSPAVVYNGVCFGAVDGKVYFLNFAGEALWTFTTGAPIFSSPTPLSSQCYSGPDQENESVLIGSHDKFVYCLSSSGELRWKCGMRSAVYSTVFVMDPRSIRETLCSPKYTHTATSTASLPDDDNRHIVVTDPGTNCLSLDNTKQTKSECLTYEQSDPVEHSQDPVIHSELDPAMCMKQSKSDSVQFKEPDCLMSNSTTCLELVVMDTLTGVRTEPVIDDNTGMTLSAVCCTDGYLYLLNSNTGDISSSYKLGGQVFSSPVTYGNHLIVGCRDNNIYCLKLVKP